jgi:molybdopterin-guanine dinucleotide biosynthesis adapter protein
MHELRGASELSFHAALERLSPCDLVLVEGFKADPTPKMEVWRLEVGKPPLYPNDPHILAIATDSPKALRPTSNGRPIFDLGDYDAIATFVVENAYEEARPSDSNAG